MTLSKRLSDCNKEEVTILTAIIALAQQLPEPMHLYTRALGTIRETYFNIGSVTKVLTSSRPRGYIDGHQIRASKKDAR